jgi:hypothetical protein
MLGWVVPGIQEHTGRFHQNADGPGGRDERPYRCAVGLRIKTDSVSEQGWSPKRVNVAFPPVGSPPDPVGNPEISRQGRFPPLMPAGGSTSWRSTRGPPSWHRVIISHPFRYRTQAHGTRRRVITQRRSAAPPHILRMDPSSLGRWTSQRWRRACRHAHTSDVTDVGYIRLTPAQLPEVYYGKLGVIPLGF